MVCWLVDERVAAVDVGVEFDLSETGPIRVRITVSKPNQLDGDIRRAGTTDVKGELLAGADAEFVGVSQDPGRKTCVCHRVSPHVTSWSFWFVHCLGDAVALVSWDRKNFR
jgi:hypothetical protein